MEEQSGVTRFEGVLFSKKLQLAFLGLCFFFALSAGQAEAAPPANDNFESARVLAGQPISTTGTTRQATTQNGEPDHADYGSSATVWFRWTPSRSGVAIIDACDDNERISALAVYSGTEITDLTELGRGYCYGSARVTSGETYLIALGSDSDWTGTFPLVIDVVDPPTNDDFANAEEIQGASVTGSTLGASREVGEPEHFEDGGDSSVWYRWTPTESGSAFVDGCGSDEDDDFWSDYYLGGVVVYTGDSLTSLTKVGEGYCSAAFSVEEGTTYYLAALGWSQFAGPFELSVQVIHPPENDSFEAATSVTTGSVTGTTLGATREAGEPSHGDSYSKATVWYSWTADKTGSALIDACSTDRIDAIAIYTGTSLGQLSRKSVGYCRLTLQVTAGTTYRVALASYVSYWGQFKLSFQVSDPPANDDFANSQVITTSPVSGSTLGATSQAGEPEHYDYEITASVWYRVTFNETATYVFDACNEDETVDAIAVYEGSNLNSLVSKGAGNCRTMVDLNAGVTYRVAVASYPAYGGAFSLKLSYYPRPANDDFAAATAITGINATLNGYTYSATKQSGEPQHAGRNGQKSVWYSWTAPTSGTTTFTVCSNFESALDIYTGGSLAELSRVVSEGSWYPDECADEGQALTFQAKAGTNYRFAIDGYGAKERGSFKLYLNHDSSVQLTVGRSGDGTGQVRSNPAGINCGTSCRARFELNKVVTLTATPAVGSTFDGWNGACSGKSDCVVTMNEAQSVTADFGVESAPPEKRLLIVNIAGDGMGEVVTNPGGGICDQTCEISRDEGTTIVLTAKPSFGSEFAGWSGACSGTGTCSVDLKTDVVVTATFTAIELTGTPSFIHQLNPRQIKLQAGRSTVLKASITNVGSAAATGTKVCVRIPNKAKKKLKVSACQLRPELAVGGVYKPFIKVKAAAKTKGKFKLQVDISASGVKKRSIPITVQVKAKPKPKKRR